jgi:hypothetical protein
MTYRHIHQYISNNQEGQSDERRDGRREMEA